MTTEGRSAPWFTQRIWPALFLALMFCEVCRAQTEPAVRDAISQLRAEALHARQQQTLPAKPDFASRFKGSLSAQQLKALISQPTNPDPFVDAYIRWQLTSIGEAPQWSDRELILLLHSLPPMIENPRAAGHVVELFERAAVAEQLSVAERARLQEMVHELDEQVSIVETLNRPALELRHWLREAQGESSLQRVLVLIEHLATTVNGGWPTQGIKMRLSRACTESALDPALTNAQRQMLAEQMQSMVGRRRRFLNEVTFMANGTVNVTFSNARILQRDVDGWIERLAGEQ